jgi:uncharacterized protein (TIGR02147 family)
MIDQLPDITEYKDYRIFFNDFIIFKKSSNPFWSYGLWAKGLGLTGASTLSMIMSGKRNPSKKLCHTFSDYFKFDQRESEYFIKLVSIQKQTKNNPELTEILLEKSKIETFEQTQKPLFFDWRAFVIRELTKLEDFQEDINWVRERLNNKMTIQEIKDVTQNLIIHGALERDASGNLKATSQTILPGNNIRREDAKIFHNEISELGRKSFNIDINQRALNSSTLSIKQENLPDAKEMIRNFQVEFSKILEEDGADEVFQLNIQFFPITQKTKHQL